jgi:hypothetical protein
MSVTPAEMMKEYVNSQKFSSTTEVMVATCQKGNPQHLYSLRKCRSVYYKFNLVFDG